MHIETTRSIPRLLLLTRFFYINDQNVKVQVYSQYQRQQHQHQHQHRQGLNKHNNNQQQGSKSRKTSLIQRIYPPIFSMYPGLANKITRMLMNVNKNELELLLEDRNAFNTTVDDAATFLKNQKHINKENNSH